MITLLLHLPRVFPFVEGSSRQLELENLALRPQLAVYRRPVTRPPLRRTDRIFWVGLATVWAGWRQSLVIATPKTVPRLRGSGVRADELVQSVPGRRRRDVLEEDRGVER